MWRVEQRRERRHTAAGKPVNGGTLRIAGAGVPTESKNVFNTQSPQEITRNRQLYDWLGYMDGEEPVPYLLESMEPNAGYTQWQLKLREGARFSDGSPVTADDVLFSIRSAGNPDIGGGLLSASAASVDLKASRAIDPRTVLLKLDAPLADLDLQIYAGARLRHQGRSGTQEAGELHDRRRRRVRALHADEHEGRPIGSARRQP